MKQQTICAKCLQSVDRILALECAHSLCLACANRLIRRLQKGTRATELARNRITSIECEICGVLSYLHPTAYEELLGGTEHKKATPRSPSKPDLSYRMNDIPSERKPVSRLDLSGSDGPPRLFCFSCQTPCFSVDEYISGMHRSHEVGNTSRPETVAALKQLLTEINEEVRKRIEVALRQSTKLTQRKRELIEQLGRSKTSIRGAFEKLREELALKETELLAELEACMGSKFTAVDGIIQQLKIFTEKCETAEDTVRCYQQAIIQADVIRGFNYYAEKKSVILEEIAEPVEKLTDTVLANAANLVASFEGLLQVGDYLKKIKLVVKDSLQIQPKDNYFQTIKQQIFYQEPHKDSVKPARNLNSSLARVKSAANLVSQKGNLLEQKYTKKPSRERQSLQTRLQQKIRGLETLLERKSRSPVRLLRRNILNI